MFSKSVQRNNLLLCSVFVLAVFAAGPAVRIASAITVTCEGNACGGPGPRRYRYSVVLGPGERMNCFDVGTCCPDITKYTNIIKPDGWEFKLYEPSYPDIKELHYIPMTGHGSISPGPRGTCLYIARWWGPELIGPLERSFGYDNPYPPHDVGFTVWAWDAATQLNKSVCDELWFKPVGTGEGPVHGPVPEPATLALFGLGGLALLRRRQRS